MALFSSHTEDYRLPIFTQFYQAEGLEEMKELIQRIDPEWCEFWTRQSSFDDKITEEAEAAIGIQPLVRRSAERLADTPKGKKPEIDTIDFREVVSKWNQSRVEEPWFCEIIGNGMMNRHNIMDKENTNIPPVLTVGDVMMMPLDYRSKVFVDPLQTIIVAMAGGPPLLRCTECNNVFLARKEGQGFCSQRCRTRHGGKRRYAEKMEGYPTTRRKKQATTSVRL